MLKFDLKHEPMDTSEVELKGFEEKDVIPISQGDEALSEWNSHKLKLEAKLMSPRYVSKGVEELKKLEQDKKFNFSVKRNENVIVDSNSMSNLYKSLKIDKQFVKNYRLNVIHMRGTQNMNTNDVFEYFSEFTPSYVEWINDASCNVVWTDDTSAAKVLLTMSKEIINLDKICFNADPFKKDLNEEMEYEIDKDAIDARNIDIAIPPGYWRLGVSTKKNEAILLRFAKRSDKKQKYAEKSSEYYKKYGNPHFGNIPGIVSSSLRRKVFGKRKNIHDDSEHMDGNVKKNPWGRLAEEWRKLDDIKDARSKIELKKPKPSLKGDLRLSINSRLEKKQKMEQNFDNESSQSDNDNYEKGMFPKMKMYADHEEKIEKKSKRSRDEASPETEVQYVEDLRLKIERSKKKKMLDQGYKRKRYWDKFKTTRANLGYHSKGTDNYDDYEDDECEDEEIGSSWALEQYSDLRESLEQNKKNRALKSKRKFEKSDNDEVDSGSDDNYNREFIHKTPLKIEFENDDYFENDSL